MCSQTSPSAPTPATDRPGRSAGIWRGPWPAVLLALLCYSTSLPNGLTYDDRALILDNPRLADLRDWRAVWLSDWWQLVQSEDEVNSQRDRLYRPLTLLTFALNYAVHGHQPAGYHVVNVLLHAGVCLLVYRFARRVVNDAAVAALAAVLFAVHPVHVEAVANVVGRAELLAAFFLLGGLLTLHPAKTQPNAGRTALAALLFLLAILSKETAICYPAVAALIWLVRPPPARPSGRGWLAPVLGLLLPLLIYFPLRYWALEGRLFRTEPADVLMNPLVVATVWQRIVTPLTILGHYLRLLVVPAKLSCDYGLAIVDPATTSLMTWIGAVGLLAIGVGLGSLAARNHSLRCVGLLTALFVASYALISNTVLLIGVTLAERFMYWPSVPALLLAALGIVTFWRRQCLPGQPLASLAGLLRVLSVLLLGVFCLRTLVRNLDWSSNLALFGSDVRTYPEGAHLNKAYATELLRLWPQMDFQAEKEQILTVARQHLDTALRIYPGYAAALTLRARVKAQSGDLDGALLDVDAALQLQPSSSSARRTQAQLIHGVDIEQRLEALRARAQEESATSAPYPRAAPARRAYADLLLTCGRYAEALAEFQCVLEQSPNDVAARLGLAKTLAALGRDQAAILAFQQVLTASPENWEAHANLASLLAPRAPSLSLYHAEQAYRLNAAEPRNAINLAEACLLNGQRERAIRLYQKVINELDPDSPIRPVVRQRLEAIEKR